MVDWYLGQRSIDLLDGVSSIDVIDLDAYNHTHRVVWLGILLLILLFSTYVQKGATSSFREHILNIIII